MDSKEINYKNVEEIAKKYCPPSPIDKIYFNLDNAALNRISKVTITANCPGNNNKSMLIKIGLFPESNNQIFNEFSIVREASKLKGSWKTILPEFFETGWLTKNSAFSVQAFYKCTMPPRLKEKRELFFSGNLQSTSIKEWTNFHIKNLNYIESMVLSSVQLDYIYKFSDLSDWFKRRSSSHSIYEKICDSAIFKGLKNSEWRECLAHGEISPRHILLLKNKSFKFIDWEYGSLNSPWPFDLIYYYISAISDYLSVRPSEGAGLAIMSLIEGKDALAKLIMKKYKKLSIHLNNEESFISAIGLTILLWLQREMKISYFNYDRDFELLKALLYLDNIYTSGGK